MPEGSILCTLRICLQVHISSVVYSKVSDRREDSFEMTVLRGKASSLDYAWQRLIFRLGLKILSSGSWGFYFKSDLIKSLLNLCCGDCFKQVQVEGEAYKESDRIVEQIYSLSAPNIAGFRLDALHTIKHTVKSTTTKNENSLDSILESIEGLVINRGTLHIRVSAVQVAEFFCFYLFCYLPCWMLTRNIH